MYEIMESDLPYEDKIDQLAYVHEELSKEEMYGPRPTVTHRTKKWAARGAIGGALSGAALGLGAGALTKHKLIGALGGAAIGAAVGGGGGAVVGYKLTRDEKKKQAMYDTDPVRYRRMQFKQDDLDLKNKDDFIHRDRDGRRRYGSADLNVVRSLSKR